MEVPVASAIKGDLLDDAVVINGHIDELRAGALGFVEEVGHNQCDLLCFTYFINVAKDIPWGSALK